MIFAFDSNARRTWLILLALSFLPFMLRIGMDFDSVERQAVLTLYRTWRWSRGVREIRTGSPLIYEQQKDKSPYEEAFKNQLQQDFKLIEVGNAPRVRAFFDSSDNLRARVEFQSNPESGEWIAWQSGVRFINNGILLGAWLGFILWILGRGVGTSVLVAIVTTLLWQVDWNFLDLPGFAVSHYYDFFRELLFRSRYRDWTASELGRLPDLGALLWFLTGGLFLQLLLHLSIRFSPKFSARLKIFRNTAILGFLMEPLALWTGSLLGHWGSDVSWWKIYLGSFAFRFVTLSHGLLGLLRPKTLVLDSTLEGGNSPKLSLWVSFLPMVFVMSGGWAWLNCVINAGSGEILLRLKVFFIGLVLAFILSSRIYSLWLGVLALAVLFPPSKGHLAAAASFGLMFDGLLLGWWLTPLKGFLPNLNWQQSGARFFTVTVLAWIIGIFLSSVGAPLSLVWVALVLAIWAYAQLSSPFKMSQGG